MKPCRPESRRRGQRVRRVLACGSAMAMSFWMTSIACSPSGGGGEGKGSTPTAGAVSVSGTWAVGETLTAVASGFTLGEPQGSYHFVWQRCTESGCLNATNIGTDAETYTLAPADGGLYVRVGAYASNICASGCGSSATVYSGAAIVPSALPTEGSASVSGLFSVGQTLTAVPSGFQMGTPAGSYHYLWQRCTDSGCASTTDIGSDSATYTLAAADLGSYVRVGVFAANACGAGCGSSSAALSPASLVLDTAPIAGTAAISGTFSVGQTLTAVPSNFQLGTPAGSYHYSWQRCTDPGCSSKIDVGSDSQTYVLTAADQAFYVRVGIYASNACASGCGASTTAYTPATMVADTMPVAGTVSVSGTWSAGQTLTAVPSGFKMGTPAGTYHYLWQRCTEQACASASLVGTDSANYALGAADVGFHVRVGVYVSNTCAVGCGSSETAYSPVGAVLDLEWANWRMPDSQTIFCTNGTSQIACGSVYGQDGNYLINPPSYTTTAETVVDNVTGLEWQRVNPSTGYTWYEAKAYCEGLSLAGRSGWRLPTLIELVSTVDLGRFNDAVDTVVFQGYSSMLWSATERAASTSSAWYVNFYFGEPEHNDKSINYVRVRCVR